VARWLSSVLALRRVPFLRSPRLFHAIETEEGMLRTAHYRKIMLASVPKRTRRACGRFLMVRCDKPVR
jgi:hypothetical protein